LGREGLPLKGWAIPGLGKRPGIYFNSMLKPLKENEIGKEGKEKLRELANSLG